MVLSSSGTKRKKGPSIKRQVESMSKIGILAEFWEFLKYRKKYWLAPIIIMLVALSALIILTEGSALAPFVYTLF
jgi:hypothetical protein